MSRAMRCFIFILLLFLIGCLPQGPRSQGSFSRMPLTEDGEVMIYLQPMLQKTDRLRFVIEEISAVRDDGETPPLFLSINEINGVNLEGTQKHLGSGVLTPGSYTGISILIKEAFIRINGGELALLVPEDPVLVDHPFMVRRQWTTALFLTLSDTNFITDQVKFRPDFSLASPGRGLVGFTGLVTSTDSNTITVFDKRKMQVVDVISTGQRPRGIVLDQARTLAYAAISGADRVAVIDLFKREIVNRLKLNFRDNPIELALTPDGRTLVSVNHDSNTVSIIDAISMTESDRIRVGEGPASAVVAPSGRKVYVMNTRSSTLSVVDLIQKRLSITIGVEGAPLRGAFNRAGTRLFVINRDTPYLTVIDPLRFMVTDKIFIGMGAVSIRLDRQRDQILVGKKFGKEIAVVDPSSLMFIDTIQVGGTPVFMTIDGEERSLLAVFPAQKRLQKINLTSKMRVAEIEVGQGAYAVVVMGER